VRFARKSDGGAVNCTRQGAPRNSVLSHGALNVCDDFGHGSRGARTVTMGYGSNRPAHALYYLAALLAG
jgi:hypothetical protein